MARADYYQPGTLEDRIVRKLRSVDYRDWRDRVAAIGGCAQPIHMFGAWQLHSPSGVVLEHHGGDILVPCGNRRQSVCPACSDRYAADAYHLMHAGLAGGAKGIPETVTEKPRTFTTVTAPSFGKVHSARQSSRGKTIPCSCGAWHHPDDPRIGTPVDPGTYDYVGAILWQANAGELWHRFITNLKRELMKAARLPVRAFTDHARLSYAKVAEYQRRGLVHFHGVMRVDGPDGPTDPTPHWVTAELLESAIHAAARSVHLEVVRPDGTPLVLRWGDQIDCRSIRPSNAHEVEEDGEISEARLAGYVAKYATKGTGKSEAADRRILSQLHLDHLKVSDHHRRMIQTAWDLGGRDEYESLNLRKWAHMLGFRGHFLSKSKYYSTTFKAIREERRAFRTLEVLDRLGYAPDAVTVVNDWAYTGSGYSTDAERELALAIAEGHKEQRRRRYEQEVAA
ncbi:replication initiation protein [Lentzea tibetensis]|uniref:Replication initiation protein n=1 Tax=Lentzea tibetensis TaxID=2591470 RepID=A0A563EZQ5_9PSEU|nr:replication initiator [Lentzea tibetensis]TWP53210.1 replication initiation protein [Lentzea tibetensis]